MKKPTQTKAIAIYAEDKKGLLGQILMLFNRRNFPVHQVNAARTDIEQMVLITLEVSVSDDQLPVIVNKVQNIVEVYHAQAYTGFEAELLQVGHFLIAKDFAEGAFFSFLQKHNVTIAGVTSSGFVIQKTGTVDDLDVFYRVMDGPALISYCRSGLIVADSLMMLENL